MRDAFAENEDVSFPLVDDHPPVVLHARGVHHPATPRGGGSAFSAYEDFTHLAASPRAVWLGTRRSVYVFPQKLFAESASVEALVRAILERIAARPDGAAILSRMAAVEERARRPSSLRATWTLAAACIAVFLLHLAVGDVVQDAGYFNAALVERGDWWRVVTAHLLHAAPTFPLHLVFNVIGLVIFGHLVERPLGSARTAWVMGAAALASMAASAWAGYAVVVGASGIVFGLVGAAVWLEWRHPESLAAWWRVPRATLTLLLVLNAALLIVPFIAGAAHVGGFLAGAAAAALVTGPELAPRVPRPALGAGTAGLVGVAALAVGTAGFQLFGPGDFEARHLARLAELPDMSPVELNNRAWMVAIDPGSSRAEKEAALRMAKRAVADTNREEPTILDTLAEIQFQLGRREQAVRTIEEAIQKAPGQRYYVEQRRRFTGDRPADDRPESPTPGPPPSGEEQDDWIPDPDTPSLPV